MYRAIERRILLAILAESDPHSDRLVVNEALRLHQLTGFKIKMIISMRLQYLRKAGKIKYLTMQRSPEKRAGWVVV